MTVVHLESGLQRQIIPSKHIHFFSSNFGHTKIYNLLHIIDILLEYRHIHAWVHTLDMMLYENIVCMLCAVLFGACLIDDFS